MYSGTVTQKQLAAAEHAAQKKDERFELKQYSAAEVEEFNLRMASLIVPETGKLSRSLTLAEKRRIKNERLMCKWDFLYWLTRYHYIFDPLAKLYIRMNPNAAQQIILSLVAEAEEQGLPIRLQNLKARRLGVTTLMEAAIQHRIQFHDNTRAVTGSSTPEKSRDMVNMIEDSLARHPWFLLPNRTQYNVGELMVFKGMGTELSVRHGAMKTDVGRGKTPTIAHLSEVAEWLHPNEDIDASLIVAMLPASHTFLSLEGTAGAMGAEGAQYWHDLWKYNKENWSNPNVPSRLRPVFLPWYIGSDIYPTPVELKSRPIPEKWEPATLTKLHAAKAKEYVQGEPLLRKHLGEAWEMPRPQMWYWEYTREYYKRMNDLNTFLREIAADDTSCFSSRFSSIFDAEIIMQYHNSRQEPIVIYSLDGPEDEVRRELKPEWREVDKNLPPKIIDKRYTLYPLLKTGYPNTMSFENKIFLWELPQPNCTYGLGVDTSKGIGQDRSVIEVIRKATLDKVGRQCAEFASSHVSAIDLPPWVHCLARLYTVNIEGETQQPKLAIEVNNGGDATQLAMRKMGWTNFHNWVRYDKKIIREDKANFLGFTMVEWARNLVVDGLIKALRDSLLDVDSPWLIEEMQFLEKDEAKARIEASYGSHDDRFMALGIILLSLHAMNWDSLKSVFGKSRVILPDPEEKKYPRQTLPTIVKPLNTDEMGIPFDYAHQLGEMWHNTAPNFEKGW